MSSLFNESTIRSLATDASYSRGVEYFQAGAVSRLTLDGDVYRAQVRGTLRYDVTVGRAEKGRIPTSCTCPYDYDGICKHIVAVMLAIQNEDPTRRAEKRTSKRKTEKPVPIEQLLAALPEEDLRRFIDLQIAENPALAENLRIYSQGTRETGMTVEDYEAEIADALKSADYGFQDDDQRYRRNGYGYDDEEENGTVGDILAPYRDTARKYHSQDNQVEAAKIHEAIVHACGKMTGAFPIEGIDEEDGEGDEEDPGETEPFDEENDALEYLGDEFHMEASEALEHWAAVLAEVRPETAKGHLLGRFAGLFALNPYAFPPDAWESAFKIVVRTRGEAESALASLSDPKMPPLDQDTKKAGALLHLLGLTGDTTRFAKVAKNAIPEYPHLALALGQKLLAVGKRIEAIEVAETALKETKSDGYWTPKCAAREPLLRFLTQACDPETDLERLIGHARTLLFEFSQPADYILVRNLLHGEEEIESLVQEAKSKCTAKALIEILSKEERWKDLMDCAARHTRDDEFPAMIRLLRDRYPEECFRLYRKALWGIVDSGTAKRIYQSAAFHARQMKEIPGHEEALARLMARIVEKYSRRRGLMSALGDLATLGRSWQERMGKERFKKVEAKRPKDIAVDELIERCPVQEKDRARLKSPYVKWHRTHAARVWAVLTAYGGRMEAADLTEALVQHLGCRPTGAGAIRSGGLRLLEALGYVEIHRQGRHLGEVRLTHKTGGTRGEKKA